MNIQHSRKPAQEVTYQIARGSQSNVGIESIVSEKFPPTFRNLLIILEQVKIIGSEWVVQEGGGPQGTIGREGDGIVSRSETGEDAGVQAEMQNT